MLHHLDKFPRASVGETTQDAKSGSSYLSWITAGIVIGGLVLVAKGDVKDQGEWNDRYGGKPGR